MIARDPFTFLTSCSVITKLAVVFCPKGKDVIDESVREHLRLAVWRRKTSFSKDQLEKLKPLFGETKGETKDGGRVEVGQRQREMEPSAHWSETEGVKNMVFA